MDLNLDYQEPDKEPDYFVKKSKMQQLKNLLQKKKKQKNGITLTYLNHHQQRSKELAY